MAKEKRIVSINTEWFLTRRKSLEEIKALLETDNLSLKVNDTVIQGQYYRLLHSSIALAKYMGYGFSKSFIVPIIFIGFVL